MQKKPKATRKLREHSSFHNVLTGLPEMKGKKFQEQRVEKKTPQPPHGSNFNGHRT